VASTEAWTIVEVSYGEEVGKKSWGVFCCPLLLRLGRQWHQIKQRGDNEDRSRADSHWNDASGGGGGGVLRSFICTTEMKIFCYGAIQATSFTQGRR